MSISERTVNFHVENVKRKFDVRSRLQLVYNAVLLGLVDAPGQQEHGPPQWAAACGSPTPAPGR